MEKRENQRVKLTKRLIREALIEQLKSKSVERISVRELCVQAGINRSTFYAHYGSQTDVLSDIAAQYLRDISDAIASADVKDPADVTRRVTVVLEYIRNHIELSRMLIGNYVDRDFAMRLISLPKIQDMLSDALDGTQEQERLDCMAFTVSGSYRLIEEWLNASDPVPPETEAQRILAIARRVCGR